MQAETNKTGKVEIKHIHIIEMKHSCLLKTKQENRNGSFKHFPVKKPPKIPKIDILPWNVLILKTVVLYWGKSVLFSKMEISPDGCDLFPTSPLPFGDAGWDDSNVLVRGDS